MVKMHENATHACSCVYVHVSMHVTSLQMLASHLICSMPELAQLVWTGYDHHLCGSSGHQSLWCLGKKMLQLFWKAHMERNQPSLRVVFLECKVVIIH